MKTTFHIETYRKGRLIDISEVGFDDLKSAETAVICMKDIDARDNERVASQIAEEGISELFNEDSDRMPVFFTPVIYTYKIGEYVQTENGLFTPEEYLSMVF